MKKLTKRVLLASLYFDLGIATSTMYMPTVSIYFDFTGQMDGRPIHLTVKYKWNSLDLFLPFNEVVKDAFKEGRVIELVKHELLEHLHEYKGDFVLNDLENQYYVSTIGRDIGFVKDELTVKQLYQKAL